MYLKGSKIIVILYVSVISCCHKVLSTRPDRRVREDKSHSYELKILNDFLGYNRLYDAIIINDFITTWPHQKRQTKGFHRNGTSIGINFVTQPLIQKLTGNYRIQFVNSLTTKGYDYLFSSFTRQVLVFMKYYPGHKGQQKILQFASQREKFNAHFVWLLITEEINDSHYLKIEKLFGHLNFLLNTDFTLAIKSKEKVNHYDLYDIYKICHQCGSPMEIEYKGNWTYDSGLFILNKFRSGIAFRRNNLKKYTIKAATTIQNKSPDLNITDLDYLNNDKDHLEEDAMQRKTFQLMNHMLYLYNATFDVQIETSWGAEVNGNWTGVVGLLQRHEAEVSLCPLRYIAKRTKALIYTTNIHYEKINFILRHPKHMSIRNIFFEPLADLVWWCILALIVLTILLLAIHVHIEYKVFMLMQKQQLHNSTNNSQTENNNNNGSRTGPLQYHSGLMIVETHFDFIVLCIMEAILMQGPAPELFRSNSTRLLILSVSVFSILLMQFYGAFIVSSLLTEPPRSINNLQALYDSGLELGMENVAYNYDLFINNTNPLVQNVYKNRFCHKSNTQQHCRNIISLEDGVRRVREGNFAFHVAIDRAYRLLKSTLTESQFCELQEIIFNPPSTFYCGLGIRKESPYHELVTRAVILFYETALLTYNNQKWVVNKIDCSAKHGEQGEVDLEHFAPALAFLLFSYVLSLLAFFIEIIYGKFLQKKNLFSNRN